MILVMECPDISEPPEFAKAFGRRDTSAAEQDLRQHFTIGAFSAIRRRKSSSPCGQCSSSRREKTLTS